MKVVAGCAEAWLLALTLSLSGASRASEAATPPDAGEHDEHVQGEALLRVTLERALSLSATRGPSMGPALANERGATEVERRSDSLLLRPPELSIAAGPRIRDGRTELDASVTVLQPLSLAGAGRARGRAAEARSALARAEVEVARSRGLLAAGVAWVQTRVAHESIELRKRGLSEAQLLDQLAGARLASGAATAGERASAQALVAAARASLLEAEGREYAAAAALAFEVGASPGRVEAIGPLEGVAIPLTEAEALAGAGAQPRLGSFVAAARALALGVERVRAEGGPVLSVGPSFAREGTGDVIVLAHLSVPIPLVNPNELEIADGERQARVARAEVSQQRARAQTEAQVALHELRHAELVRDALAREAIPPARIALEEASLRYREGKASFQEVVTARRGLFEVEERQLEAAGQARVAELQLLATIGQLGRGVR